MAQRTASYLWLKRRCSVPRGHWPPPAKSCKTGQHHVELYQAVNQPIDLDRFGESSFYCSAGCPSDMWNPLSNLSEEARAAVHDEFVEVRRIDQASKLAARRAARLEEVRLDAVPARKPHEFFLECKKKVANETNETVTAKAKGKAKAVPQKPTRTRTASQATVTEPKLKGKANGKAKAKTRTPEPEIQPDVPEDDEYNTDSYEIGNDERRTVEIIAYMEPDTEPIQQIVNLRAVSHFDFNYFHIAKLVNSASDADSGLPFTSYVWFCVLKDEWCPVSSPINLRPRGRFLLCRPRALAITECPGIVQWAEIALGSVLALAGEPEDSEEEGYIVISDSEPELPPSSSLASSPVKVAAVAGSSRLAAAAGPSPKRKRKLRSSSSTFIDTQTEILAAEDEEDVIIRAIHRWAVVKYKAVLVLA
ncbi:hypothetical protein B0H17DRAFT_1126844 [Mycena rosella]|uniref:Uncharacterized protein n=1 Tax=Mycena rosella TaxID=1033263 RepID=A0AAD7M7J2_MYCRO|nr:hypothetical protein B0H17DRAFT_1126844 [Mycena rosella]